VIAHEVKGSTLLAWFRESVSIHVGDRLHIKMKIRNFSSYHLL